jgi:hypothetical protein
MNMSLFQLSPYPFPSPPKYRLSENPSGISDDVEERDNLFQYHFETNNCATTHPHILATVLDFPLGQRCLNLIPFCAKTNQAEGNMD